MRNLTIILFCFFANNILAQTSETINKGFYAFKYKLPFNEKIRIVGTNKEVRPKGSFRFRISKISNDTIYFRFKYGMSDPKLDKGESLEDFVNQGNSKKEFYITKSKGEIYTFNFQGLAWGALIAPIKIRPKTQFNGENIPLKLTTDISIGPYIGYQFGRTSFSNNEENTITHTIAAFASPYTSFTEVNTSNSTDDSKNGTTVAAFSFGTGYLFEISHKIQLGALVGWDFIGGDLAEKWYYQGKPWYSLAIGFNFTK